MSQVEVLEQTSTVEVAQDGVLEVLEESTFVVEVLEQDVVELQVETPLVLEVVERGLQGPPGRDGLALLPLVYERVSPAATWVITHNLGRHPAVTLIVDGRVEYTDIVHPDLNTTTITWPEPTVGRAELL